MLIKWKAQRWCSASDHEGAAVPVGLDTRAESTPHVHLQLVWQPAGRRAHEDLHALVRAHRQESFRVSGSRRRGLDEPGSATARTAARLNEQATSVPPDELRCTPRCHDAHTERVPRVPVASRPGQRGAKWSGLLRAPGIPYGRIPPLTEGRRPGSATLSDG